MIHKIRFGYATNSSSTHSVVLYSGANPPPNELPGDDQFGWEDFTLSTPEGKKAYIDSQWEHAKGVEEPGMGIDHQSVWCWPRDISTGAVSQDFYEILLKEIVENPKALVLGGNDNGGEHYLSSGEKTRPHPLWQCLHNGQSVVRKDPKGWVTYLGSNYWDKPQGFKIRFGDGDGKKSTLPELMDLKITDQCGYGCKFCYQGSTPYGKHATRYKLNQAVKVLKDLQVMEVAIGGGEPTTHPDFISFTQALKTSGIIANVTTKNKDWVKNRNRWRTEDGITGVGFSVSSAAEVERNYFSTRVYHVVMGVTPLEEVRRIILKANHVLLLDFKTTGRGLSYPVHDYSELVPLLRAAKQLKLQDFDEEDDPEKSWSIGIDTPLAKRFEKELAEAGIPEVYYETEEGKHSAYWDLVKGEFGPSSYNPSAMVKIPKGAKAEWFAEQFAKW